MRRLSHKFSNNEKTDNAVRIFTCTIAAKLCFPVKVFAINAFSFFSVSLNNSEQTKEIQSLMKIPHLESIMKMDDVNIRHAHSLLEKIYGVRLNSRSLSNWQFSSSLRVCFVAKVDGEKHG